MPFNLPIANKGAGAPEIEDGLALGRFDDLRLVPHDDWAGTDQYGNPDDGQRFHFMFTMVEPDGAVIYAVVNGENTGDPLELEGLTRTATGKKSNFRKFLAGILTPAEMTAWDNQTEEDPYDFSAVQHRIVNVVVAHSEKSGWPNIAGTVGPAKIKAAPAKKKSKAELEAEIAALQAAAEAEGEEA
jgi:hypothetical protein